MISGVGWRPARSAAGSVDGKTLKMMKVTALTTTSSSTMPSSRRTMNRAMRFSQMETRTAGPAARGRRAGRLGWNGRSLYLIEVKLRSQVVL